jgi:hypothetical protein
LEYRGKKKQQEEIKKNGNNSRIIYKNKRVKFSGEESRE